MPRAAGLTEEQVRAAHREYMADERMTVADICRQLGVTHTAVMYHFKKLDLPRKNRSSARKGLRGISEDQARKTHERHVQEMIPALRLAKEIGYSQSALVNRWKEFDLDVVPYSKRPRGIRKISTKNNNGDMTLWGIFVPTEIADRIPDGTRFFCELTDDGDLLFKRFDG